MCKFFQFIRQKRELLCYALLSTCVLLAVYFFSGFPASAVLYAALLEIFILLVMLVPSYFRWSNQMHAVREFENAILDSTTALSAPGTPLEQAYQTLVMNARSQCMAMKSSQDKALNETMTYYTLWIHQIKTPIAAMRLILEDAGDLRAKMLPELFKVEQYASLALQYMKMRDIVEDMVVEKCDVYEIVRSSVKKYAVLFVYQGIKMDIAPFSKEVISDKKWITFVVEQILSNAVKYTKAGSVSIFMQQNTLHIKDTGIGIRPEDLPLVTDKGYTGHNGRVDERASGIGLYLTKRVCDALNISIGIESRVNVGTDVSLTFPDVTKM